MLSVNILTSNHANGFVFVLKVFQDKCNRDGIVIRAYFQCRLIVID